MLPFSVLHYDSQMHAHAGANNVVRHDTSSRPSEPESRPRGCVDPGADPGISGGRDDMDEEKIGRGLGAAVGPQRGPGAESLVGVKGAKPPTKVTLFSRIIQ
jgi:hypothetical protein